MRRLAPLLFFAWTCAQAGLPVQQYNDVEEKVWKEEEAALPAYPQDKDLIEFPVSATTSNHFFIDASTLEVGKDGVVRYTLVIKTAGGATNVSREGLRCEANEYRAYAMGRADGTWVKARNVEWRRYDNNAVNRYQAALSRDYFCPRNMIIVDAEEGRRALRLGQNPRAATSGTSGLGR